MHIYINAGTGEDADGYVDLICKGKILDGSRFSKSERAAWNPNVRMFFQKNAWMDTVVMIASAEKFNKHLQKRWGKGAKVLLTCVNLLGCSLCYRGQRGSLQGWHVSCQVLPSRLYRISTTH